MKHFIPIFLFAVCFALPVMAQQQARPVNPNKNEPMEITADQTLEWHRDDQKYIARGNVIAKQGDVQIFCDTLTADYRETAESSQDIYKLTAEGNVRIISQGNTATGDLAVYEVDKGLAVMTGNNLSLRSPDQTVTARDRFEYHVAQGQLKALGGVKVLRGEDTLEADQGIAQFAEDNTGKRQLQQMEAIGNVVITTPTEVLRGQRGIYKSNSNIAELIGDVTITRGQNILEGERAEVNLATNVSKMHGGASRGGSGNGGRVRGVFYPGSDGAAGDGIQPVPQTTPQAQPYAAPQPLQQPAVQPQTETAPRGMLTR